jgi:hypothetical protein
VTNRSITCWHIYMFTKYSQKKEPVESNKSDDTKHFGGK